MKDFTGAAEPISPGGFAATVAALNVGPVELWTVLGVETRGCGFLPDRRPLILFERHIFHRQTEGIYGGTNPNVSNSEPGGYLTGAREYDRLAEAIALDRHAALSSTSWGIGQVMGFNAERAGFATVEAMVGAMIDSEDVQLAAMAAFVRAVGLHIPLARHDWTTFAHGYNGPDFQKNAYDQRLGTFFQQFSRGPLPDLRIRQAQIYLRFLGLNPGPVDGVSGELTRGAIARFRERAGLGDSTAVDEALIASLRAKVAEIGNAAGV